jgi:DNA polymerase III delta prime subunit
MKKVSMQIVDIEENTNPNGISILRITAKSEGIIYKFGAKEEDYIDEKTRKKLDQGFLKAIKKSQERSMATKTQIDQNAKNVKDLIGTEVEEVVY